MLSGRRKIGSLLVRISKTALQTDGYFPIADFSKKNVPSYPILIIWTVLANVKGDFVVEAALDTKVINVRTWNQHLLCWFSRRGAR